jgi:hypothetical protein
MEDRGRHRIGISQNQPHINADVAHKSTTGWKDSFRKTLALPVLNYHVFRHRVNANRRILVL